MKRSQMAKQARHLPKNGALLPTTPARIGVCSPIAYATDRPIGAIERRTRITVWTNDPAAGAARRIGSAAGTMTDVADLFAMSDGGRLVGNRALRQAPAGDQRKNRCHREDSFSHERPVRVDLKDVIAQALKRN